MIFSVTVFPMDNSFRSSEDVRMRHPYRWETTCCRYATHTHRQDLPVRPCRVFGIALRVLRCEKQKGIPRVWDHHLIVYPGGQRAV